MHEDYDDYDDYDESQNNLEGQYKNYFKFDPDAWDAWGKMLYDALNNMGDNNVWYVSGFTSKSFPVNSFFPNTGDVKNHLYLGKNYYNENVFKKHHFIKDSLKNNYINHIKQYAVHFLKQPSYYNSMFDILN
jgi:hypothetical protein